MPAGKLSVLFEEKEVTIRGAKFRFREITGGDYEDIIKLTAGPDGSADLAPVLRLMVLKSLIDPKIDAEDYNKLPLPVVREINNVVNEMHFGERTNGASPEVEIPNA